VIEAFVFMSVESGAEDEVWDALLKMPEVKEVMLVYGPYDFIVRISASTAEDLRKLVAERLRRLPRVRSTMTLVIARSETKQ
jgi:DNA-binding Lrp family transcriptional regulator